MSKNTKPTHRAYLVTEPKDKNKKPIFHRVGAVWPYESGKGFNLVITPGMSVTGKIVCLEIKDAPETDSTIEDDEIPY
jgi:hypothetical protein